MIQRGKRPQIGCRLAKSGKVVEFYYRKAYKKVRKRKALWRVQAGIRRILDRHPDWTALGIPTEPLHGWMILDDGMLLQEIDENGESTWTTEDAEAMVFATREKADRFIVEHWEEIEGVAVNR